MHHLSILPGPGLADVVTLIQRLEATQPRSRPPRRPARRRSPGSPPQPVKGITMNERTIDVQVVDGRVYHRNLEFLVDDVPVRSYGSVGFDQTIALVIEVPVQAKWVGGTPALQPLIGQIIEIPVSGTFTQWKVDERAVGNFLAQAAQTAVGGAIGDELNKALEGLFRREVTRIDDSRSGSTDDRSGCNLRSVIRIRQFASSARSHSYSSCTPRPPAGRTG